MLVVFFQVLLVFLVVGYSYFRVKKEEGAAPIQDLGIIWLIFFLLYSALPPLSFLLQGGEFHPSNRLNWILTNLGDVVSITNIALGYVLSFVFFYFWFRETKGRHNEINTYKKPILLNRYHLIAASLIILLNLFINFYFGTFSIIPSPDSYREGYIIAQSLPLGLRQITKVLYGITSVAWLVLLSGLFQSWPKHRFLTYFLILIFIYMNFGGARSQIAFFLFAVVICRHVYIKSISSMTFFFGGAISLLLFYLIGIYRALGSGDFLFSSIGELDNVWGNAVMLRHEIETNGISYNLALIFSDFYAFIPSQLLWFEKVAPSGWFIDLFYSEEHWEGLGFGFGILSQAIVGGGIIEAIIRGSILGFLAAKLMKLFNRQQGLWWHFPLQLFLLTNMVSGIRDTSFRLLGDTIQIFFLGIIIIYLISEIISASHSKSRNKFIYG